MSEDKVEVVRRTIDAYNRRDLDGFFAELGTSDFEWYPAITRALGGESYRGREGVERFAADTAENWEELQNTAAEFRDLGDRVLVLGRLQDAAEAAGPRSISRTSASSIFAASGSGATASTSTAPKDFPQPGFQTRRADARGSGGPGVARRS